MNLSRLVKSFNYGVATDKRRNIFPDEAFETAAVKINDFRCCFQCLIMVLCQTLFKPKGF